MIFTGLPSARRMLARHLPGSCSNARTTNRLYSICYSTEILDGPPMGKQHGGRKQRRSADKNSAAEKRAFARSQQKYQKPCFVSQALRMPDLRPKSQPTVQRRGDRACARSVAAHIWCRRGG